MKTCNLCNIGKPLDQFHKHSGRKDGRTNTCKQCACERTKRWKDKHPDYRPTLTEDQKQSARQRAKEWRLNNPERFNENKLAWASNNSEKMHQYKLEWQRRNRHKVHANTMLRKAQKLSATPKWADKSAIEEIYGIARDMCVLTGERWEVDHIVPLRAEKACGLHVHFNLRVVPMKVNRSKQNAYEIE